MAVADSSSINEQSIKACSYFRVSSLTETILGASKISNLRDRYTLGEQLGWGQFGVIRGCSDKLTGEVSACKSIAKDRLVTAADVRSVKLEIEIMTRLSGHPNVVHLKEVYEEEGHVHLVMELCAGGELFHRIEKQGRFSEAETRLLFRHLMQVVLYCHEKGVVHRDLKPENILLATRASSSPIKLADFGLATYINPGQSLQGTVGSPFYIAPEVLVGGYNQAADVWSAGVILYILLSGTPPFWGKTKSRIFDAVRAADLRFPSDPWDSVSASAKTLIRGMLRVDPSQRLSAKEVLDHSWLEDNVQNFVPDKRNVFGTGDMVAASCMSRDQDISFGTAGSHIICDAQSPAFSCKSSFSSFFVEQSSPPRLNSGAFSFRSCGSSSSSLELFCSPIPSIPSFTFFSPGPVNLQDGALSRVSLAELIVGELPSSCAVLDRETDIKWGEEAKRAGGGPGPRMSGIHSKRNRTIGLGEHEQLDLMVNDSVIRWSSCTLIPTSLRSSLVC